MMQLAPSFSSMDLFSTFKNDNLLFSPPPSIYSPFCVFERINKSQYLHFYLSPDGEGDIIILRNEKPRPRENLLAKAKKQR